MRAPGDREGWSHVLAVGAALLVLVLFLSSFGTFLSPFLFFWVLVVVMLPFRGTVVHVPLLGLAGLLTLLWLLDTTGFLLAPFALALVLAYILDPAIDRLSAGRIGRSTAIVLLALPVVAAVGVGSIFGLPAAGNQIGELIQEAPALLDRIAGWIEGFEGRLLRVDFPIVDEQALVDRLRAVDSAALITFLQERQSAIGQSIWSGVLGLGRGLGSVFSILGYVVLTPVLTFYILRDYDQLVARVRDLIPHRNRSWVVDLARDFDRDLAAYLRGQITVALVIGTVTALGLWLTRFPYAFLLGAMVGVFGLVPYLGLVLSLIPAILIALLSANIGLSLLKVVIVFGVAQTLEAAVVSPRVVGDSVGLHPVWVVLALSVGGFFLGFLGLLLGVPLAVGVKLILVRLIEAYRASALFRGGSAPPAE